MQEMHLWIFVYASDALFCRFDAAGGASAEANNLAVAQLAGLDPSDVIMGEWSSSVLRPCHYVAADRANHCIVLSVRLLSTLFVGAAST